MNQKKGPEGVGEGAPQAKKDIGKPLKWAEDLKKKQKVKSITKDQEKLAHIAARAQAEEEEQVQRVAEKLASVQISPKNPSIRAISPAVVWTPKKDPSPQRLPVKTAAEREKAALDLAKKLKHGEERDGSEFSEREFLNRNKSPSSSKQTDWAESIRQKKRDRAINNDKAKLANVAAKNQEVERLNELKKQDELRKLQQSPSPTQKNPYESSVGETAVTDTPDQIATTVTPPSLPPTSQPPTTYVNPQPIPSTPTHSTSAAVTTGTTGNSFVEANSPEPTTKEMARRLLMAAKKKANDEGVPFDETEFIIQLVESKRREYEQAKQHFQQAAILNFFEKIETSLGVPSVAPVQGGLLSAPAAPEQVPEAVHSKPTASLPLPPTSLAQPVTASTDGSASGLPDSSEASGASNLNVKQPESTGKSSSRRKQTGEAPSEEPKAAKFTTPNAGEKSNSREDLISPEIKERVRVALKTAKDKALRAGLPFDDATAIIIAQEMLQRAARQSRSGSPLPIMIDEKTLKEAMEDPVPKRATPSELSQRVMPPRPPSPEKTLKGGSGQNHFALSPPHGSLLPSKTQLSEEESERDQLRLAIVSARKKAIESGEPFDEEIFTAVYERKRRHQLSRKSKAPPAKLPLPVTENNTELETILRDQAKVAARSAKQQAAISGEWFDEVDFTVRFIINRRREMGLQPQNQTPTKNKI